MAANMKERHVNTRNFPETNNNVDAMNVKDRTVFFLRRSDAAQSIGCASPRKRKPVHDYQRGRVVKMQWEMEPESTTSLFEELGVSSLDDDCEDRPHSPLPNAIIHNLIPPGAPKVTVLPNPSQDLSIGGYAKYNTTPLTINYMEAQTSEDDDSLMTKRHRSPYGDGDNHWNRLSDEMMLSILRWLPKMTLVRCARVCRRWNRLALDETLWKRLDLAGKTLKAGVVGRVLDRGVIVLRLAKTEVQEPLYTIPATLSPQKQLSKVQYLDLSMSLINVTALEQLLSHCHFLQKLSIENCQVNDLVCRYIGQNRNLEVLDMCMVQGITENGLVPICNNLQHLEALNVAWTNMTRGAVLYLVICLTPTLVKLNLSGCRETLLDEDVQQLCGSCPHLKELDLSDSTLLTSASVEYIAGMLRGLEYIALSRCYHIAPAALPLLNNIHTLLALDVFGMLQESALRHLRAAMMNIEINKFPFSSIARPTTGIRRTSIWGLRVRDSVV